MQQVGSGFIHWWPLFLLSPFPTLSLPSFCSFFSFLVFFLFLFLSLWALRIEFRASCMLAKCSATGLLISLSILELGSCQAVQISLGVVRQLRLVLKLQKFSCLGFPSGGTTACATMPSGPFKTFLKKCFLDIKSC